MKKFLTGLGLTLASLVLVVMLFFTTFNFLPNSTQDKVSQFIKQLSGQTSVLPLESEPSTETTSTETNSNETNSNEATSNDTPSKEPIETSKSNEKTTVSTETKPAPPKNNQEAEKYYEQAEALWMKSSKELNHSLELVDKALAIDPNNIKYQRLKCDLLSDLGQDRAAIELGEKIIKQIPNPISHDYWILAVSYERIGDTQKADSNYDKAIEVAKDGKTAATYWIAKADIAHENKKYDSALKCYNEAAKADGSFNTAAQAMGHFYEIYGKPEQMLMYENIYLGYVREKNSIVKDQKLANKMNKEISTLKSAVGNGVKEVDDTFPAIYESISRYAILGIDPYNI